jgi:RimJ/RimL family protein N-acetyltransferase
MTTLFSPGRGVPVVETERLRLRGHRAEDFRDSFALWSDPVVTRFIGGKPLSEEEVWARVLRYVGHWAWMGFGYWAVEEKATGRFVGEMGLSDWKRDLSPSIHGIPEVGWIFAPRFHGQGYATEAVRAAIAWGRKHLGSNSNQTDALAVAGREPALFSARLVCLIDPENVPSIRVAQKCGFQEVLRTSYHGEPTILFTQ